MQILYGECRYFVTVLKLQYNEQAATITQCLDFLTVLNLQYKEQTRVVQTIFEGWNSYHTLQFLKIYYN